MELLVGILCLILTPIFFWIDDKYGPGFFRLAGMLAIFSGIFLTFYGLVILLM